MCKGFPIYHSPISQQREGGFSELGACREAWQSFLPLSAGRAGDPISISGSTKSSGGRNTKSAQLDRVNSHPAKATGSKAQVSCSLGAGGSSCRSSCSEFWPWSQEYNRKTVVLGVFNLPFPERSGQIGLAYAGVGGKAISAEEEEMPSCRQSQALNELNYGRRSG